MASPDLRPLSVGEILDVAFQLFRRLFAPLVVIQVVCTAVPVAVNVYVQASGGTEQNFTLTMGVMVLSIVLSAIAMTASIHLISAHYLGKTLTAGEALARAMGNLGAAVAVSLMVGLLVGVGILLLVVPGIILLCGLVVALQALVLEPDTGATQALSRSWQLTKGHKGRMFGLLLAIVAITMVPALALGALAGVGAGAGALTGAEAVGAFALALIALGAILQMVLYPYLYCAVTVAYYDLRVRKEAFDLQVLASSFQGA